MKIKMEICTTKVLLFFVWLYVRVQDGNIRLSLFLSIYRVLFIKSHFKYKKMRFFFVNLYL